MWEFIWHVLLHTLTDTVKMLPFLFAAYLVIEYIEHKKSHKIEALLAGTGKYGFIAGSLLGCFPQCGFSVAAANFYAGRVITMGTLVSVFIATSDEAIPLLISAPQSWHLIGILLLAKIVIAIVAGFFTDYFLQKKPRTEQNNGGEEIHEKICGHCGCERHGIFYAALRHTISIFFFILLVSFLLNAVIEFFGEDQLSAVLMDHSVFQPVIAAFIGLIPNCASSVVLTELLLSGAITFGAAVAGLCAGAGVGLLVLFRVNKRLRENFCILGIILVTGIAAGWILQLFGL